MKISRLPGKRRGGLVAVAAAAAASVGVAAFGSAGAMGKNAHPASSSPIIVGASISQSGDFAGPAADALKGYKAWAAYTNAHGGLLGRQVKLDILDDGSNPQQVITDYQKLITVDHANLLLGPFSTLLTQPATQIAHRYNYAIITGLGGKPIASNGFNTIVDTNSLMDGYVSLLKSLKHRPKTAAYVTENDPFTQPQIEQTKKELQAIGIKTVLFKVYGSEVTDYTPIASAVVNSHAQLVVAGAGLPDLTAFVQDFKQQKYNPQAFITAGGADEGSTFLKAVGGAATAEGIAIPGLWSPSVKEPMNAQFVSTYTKMFGGTANDISVTAAQAFTAAEVAGEAVQKAHSLDQSKLISTLKSGHFTSIRGPVRFNSANENIAAPAYQLQWQHGALKIIYPSSIAQAHIEYPKPHWPGT